MKLTIPNLICRGGGIQQSKGICENRPPSMVFEFDDEINEDDEDDEEDEEDEEDEKDDDAAIFVWFSLTPLFELFDQDLSGWFTSDILRLQ